MMNATLTAETADFARPAARQSPPVAVQILSTLLYGAFAITAVSLAFAHFWPAGVALAIVLGWRGGVVAQRFGAETDETILERVRALGPEAQTRASGNTNFDAYRADTLRRLEDEQDSFGTFLDRLRAAKDKTEFDRFVDARAAAARTAPDDTAA